MATTSDVSAAPAGAHHHHVVCRRCGAVADVECVVGRDLCLVPPSAGGFVLDETDVTYRGLCPRCCAAPAS